MFKLSIFFSCFLALGCTSQMHKTDNPDARYFSDATDCFHSSEQKQSVNIPTTPSVTVIDIPLASDAGAFRLCMEHKGHPVIPAKANADDYLNVSRACLLEARSSSAPNESYATCVNRGRIIVEQFDGDATK